MLTVLSDFKPLSSEGSKLMRKRTKLKKKTSKKLFKRTAMKVKRKNFAPAPMRGGIRL